MSHFDTHASRCGLGLNSMQQRAERLNVHLTIQSDCEEGTTLTLACPLGNEKPTDELSLAKGYVPTTQNALQDRYEYIPD